MAESGSETGDDDWMLSDDVDWEAVARAAEAGGGERADEQGGEHSGMTAMTVARRRRTRCCQRGLGRTC